MTRPERALRRRTAGNSDLHLFEGELREQNCLEDFQSLVDAQCSPEWLMDAVSAIRLAYQHHARLQNDPVRMNSRRLKTLLEKTRWVARQWEQQLQTDFGKEILQFAGRNPILGRRELLNTPSGLLSLAKWASDVQRGTARHRRPLLDDCLAQLAEYVNLQTGKYHDREVSALIAFAIERDSYNETTLCVWRAEHSQALQSARTRFAKKH